MFRKLEINLAKINESSFREHSSKRGIKFATEKIIRSVKAAPFLITLMEVHLRMHPKMLPSSSSSLSLSSLSSLTLSLPSSTLSSS